MKRKTLFGAAFSLWLTLLLLVAVPVGSAREFWSAPA